MKPSVAQIIRVIGAPPDQVFEAWTNPEFLTQWWAPAPMTCPEAEVDLRAGGVYRLANRNPDGSVIWITGTFKTVQRPHLLVYTWVLEHMPDEESMVQVDFNRHDSGTEVVIRHQRIVADADSEEHVQGWNGCLDKLRVFVETGHAKELRPIHRFSPESGE